MTLETIIKRTFESRDIYHTTRNNSNLNLKSKYQRPPWNLENTYGLCDLIVRREFIVWLKYLGAGLPTSQGSRRGSSDSGQDFWRRNFNPWSNPHLIYTGPRRQVKEYYRSILDEEETFWEQETRNRKAQGMECCSKCAQMGHFDDELCSNCLPEARRELTLGGSSINSDSDSDYPVRATLRDKLRNTGIGIISSMRKDPQEFREMSELSTADSEKYSHEDTSQSVEDGSVINGRPPDLEDLPDRSTNDQTLSTAIPRLTTKRKGSENGIYQPSNSSGKQGRARKKRR